MARTLTYGHYSHIEVYERLSAPAARIGQRFELLDNSNQVLGTLDTIDGAQVSVDTDRKINGAVRLTMQRDDRLLDQMLQRRVRPWFQIGMRDGGVAEWPMGVYVLTEPDRNVEAVGLDDWQVTLLDLSYLPESGGPDLPGYTATKGSRITDHVRGIWASVGVTDFSGIEPSEATVAADTFWGLVRVTGIVGEGPFAGYPIVEQGQTSPQTWLSVLGDLHLGAGAYAPWVDLAGRPRFQIAPDLARVSPTLEYSTSTRQLIDGFDTSNDPSLLANRVVARASNTGGFVGYQIVDANQVIPNHPLAQRNLGYYMSVTIDNATAQDDLWLYLSGVKELLMRFARHKSVSLRTMPNPAHERNEIVGLAFEDDAEFAAGARFQERGWTLDLFTGQMGHTLYLLVDGVT